MAEGRGAAAVPPSAPPPCRLGGGAAGRAAPAPGRQCCGSGVGGCGLGLARLVRRRGRRALRSAAASAAASQPRRRAYCQYDPLSYARNFDLGGCDGDANAARVYYSCSFSSRFVLVPAASSQSTAAGAGAASAGAAPAAVATAS